MKQYLKRLVTSVFALVLFSAPCLARKDVQEDRSCDSDAPRILRNGKTEIIDSSLFRPSGVHGNHNVTVASLPVSGSIGLKYVNKFLSEDAIQKLISFCDDRSGWTASPQNYGGDGTIVKASRTSSSCPIILPLLYLPKLDLLRKSGRLTEAIEEEITFSWSLMQRIADFLEVDVGRIEPLQLIRYTPGQFYRQHHDHGSYYGVQTEQRPITFLLFLSSMPSSDGGGHTRFGELDIAVLPRAGDGIIWSNEDNEGNILTEAVHEAVPPKDGGNFIKFAMNVWIAEEPIMKNIDAASYRTS